MKSRLTAFLICLLPLLGLAACQPQGEEPQAPAPITSLNRTMLALDMFSGSGDQNRGASATVEPLIQQCLVGLLPASDATSDWTLVWGPMVWAPYVGAYDLEMMYAVQSNTNKNQIAVVIRGTNQFSEDDWALDFSIKPVAWPYPTDAPPSGVLVAKGLLEDLQLLVGHAPKAATVPGYGQTIEKFIATQIASLPANTSLKVAVTGHSKGGGLSPMLAQYFYDNHLSSLHNDWQGKVILSVYAFAGQTPGNTAFKGLYESSFASQIALRFHQPYDPVPYAWNTETIAELSDLYAPTIHPDTSEMNLINSAIAEAQGKDYQQLGSDVPVAGVLNTAFSDWTDEAVWQHICGYKCQFNLVEGFPPVPRLCPPPIVATPPAKNADPFTCPPCPTPPAK